MRRRLDDAIESTQEGFALFDADDRLLLRNSRYGELLYDGAGVPELGTPYRTILHRAVERGVILGTDKDSEVWIEERMAAHRSPSGSQVQQRSNGRWLSVSEHRAARAAGPAGRRARSGRQGDDRVAPVRSEKLGGIVALGPAGLGAGQARARPRRGGRHCALAPVAPMTELRAATHNIHGCVGTDRRYDPARIVQVIREIDADVIALQEVDDRMPSCDGRGQFDHLVRATGLCGVAGPKLRDHRGHYGNAILSRFPIEAVRRIDISVPPHEPRGALDVEVRLPAGRVRVIATHLGIWGRERRRQIARLIQNLQLPQHEGVPTLLMATSMSGCGSRGRG